MVFFNSQNVQVKTAGAGRTKKVILADLAKVWLKQVS